MSTDTAIDDGAEGITNDIAVPAAASAAALVRNPRLDESTGVGRAAVPEH
jgi:hypothetical protein